MDETKHLPKAGTIDMTDNTEAVEKLAEAVGAKWSDKLMITEILDAIQADPLVYMKPKPLEWVVDEEYGHLFSGPYEITRPKVRLYIYETAMDVEGADRWIDYPTLEAAQAAAQEDLHNRIKELF